MSWASRADGSKGRCAGGARGYPRADVRRSSSGHRPRRPGLPRRARCRWASSWPGSRAASTRGAWAPGGPGGTNALRAMGPRRALVVGLLDVAKGAVPILVAIWVGASPVVGALTGLAAVFWAPGSRCSCASRAGGASPRAWAGCSRSRSRWCSSRCRCSSGIIAITRYVSLGSLLGTAIGALVSVVFVASAGSTRHGCCSRPAPWSSSGSPTRTTSSGSAPARSAGSTPRRRRAPARALNALVSAGGDLRHQEHHPTDEHETHDEHGRGGRRRGRAPRRSRG